MFLLCPPPPNHLMEHHFPKTTKESSGVICTKLFYTSQTYSRLYILADCKDVISKNGLIHRIC